MLVYNAYNLSGPPPVSLPECVSYTSIDRAHKRLGYTLGYPAKLDRLAQVTHANAKITDAIAKLAEQEFDIDVPPRGGTSIDLMRVREALKHFIRDWSSGGLRERDKIFAPILDVLRTVDADERANQRVLFPDSGLGRLTWEISELGFHETTANEISFFMTLALRFLLEPSTTAVDQHLIHPYAHWFSHQRSADSLFRSISFPDAIPRLSPRFKLIEKDFLTLRPPPVVNPLLPPIAGYDYIVTLFFINTSLNILTTLAHIYSLLRPGGTWINLGPLLWTSDGQAKLELTLEEVLRAAEELGFVIYPREDGQQSQTVECEYTGDAQAMMRWIYRAEFWVAHKPK
ncbi:N2227-like protein-domain-containing protein [Mycena metata]|uniref:N2227-like protein-domain-containing protein n=1 Tax=Mycena metata TaxID=1033252 RepID=A0AAD7IJP3_9AGAR|nr:N2227-like protein-domain-containing protein [Mycena metata]